MAKESIRNELSELILAKEDLERQTESLIKKVVASNGSLSNLNSDSSHGSLNIAVGHYSLDSNGNLSRR